jgi:hypothetical protein
MIRYFGVRTLFSEHFARHPPGLSVCARFLWAAQPRSSPTSLHHNL